MGVAAANLSKRPFSAKLEEFTLRGTDGKDIEPRPFKMAKLVNSGVVKLPDGTMVFEGAGDEGRRPQNAPAAPQTNMGDYKGEWRTAPCRQSRW